jgi:hypothetical protein
MRVVDAGVEDGDPDAAAAHMKLLPGLRRADVRDGVFERCAHAAIGVHRADVRQRTDRGQRVLVGARARPGEREPVAMFDARAISACGCDLAAKRVMNSLEVVRELIVQRVERGGGVRANAAFRRACEQRLLPELHDHAVRRVARQIVGRRLARARVDPHLGIRRGRGQADRDQQNDNTSTHNFHDMAVFPVFCVSVVNVNGEDQVFRAIPRDVIFSCRCVRWMSSSSAARVTFQLVRRSTDSMYSFSH